MTLAPLHPTHATEPTPLHDALKVRQCGQEAAAYVRDALTTRFAESIARRHTCRELRSIARRRKVAASGSKFDIALRLAAQGIA